MVFPKGRKACDIIALICHIIVIQFQREIESDDVEIFPITGPGWTPDGYVILRFQLLPVPAWEICPFYLSWRVMDNPKFSIKRKEKSFTGNYCDN